MNKFEQLVEFIINEDEDKAQELFHEIVVQKSREIYNDLVNESDDQTDDFVSDIEADEYGTDMHAEDSDMDDDMEDDMEADEDSNEQDDADVEEIEDRVVDLEAELDALKSEFDAMMTDDEPEMDMDDEPEMEEALAFENDSDEVEDDEEIVREYVEKVAAPKGEDHKADSTVAGKNDMGGTAGNIAQGGEEAGGKVAAPKQNDAGNKNKPGAKQGVEKAPAPKKGE